MLHISINHILNQSPEHLASAAQLLAGAVKIAKMQAVNHIVNVPGFVARLVQ